MMKLVELSSLGIGRSLYVTDICGSGPMAERLRDLGVTEGTKIKCVMKSPLGDPKAYEIRGAVIALRREDAACILGTYEPPEKCGGAL